MTQIWFENTDGSYTIKDPGDIDDWVFDMTGLLPIASASGGVPAYDPLTGTPTVTPTDSTMTVQTISLLAGKGGADTAVGWWATGGTAGTDCGFTIKASTVGGRTRQITVWLKVADR